MNRIGIDVGGTFTDVVLVDDASGQIWSTKVPTTPADRVVGAMQGFRRILELSGRRAADVGFIGHGTTMATNMIVERTGARTALVTTAGFRDVLELRRVSRHDRADLYDLQFENPAPLVERRWRLEVPERIRHDGSVETSLDVAALRAIAARLQDSPIEAVAICFLHSYANAEHEKQALAELRRLLPTRFVTASHEVNPEMQEYERTSSTVINAMLGPVCGRYARGFESQLRQTGFKGELLFMQSNGGLASLDMVAARPIVLLESGPAGGVSAAVRNCEQAGMPGVILGDMGGTTFDVSLIQELRPEIRTQSLLHTHAVRAPTIDIDSIGAGGGSIAWIDSGGGVRIGPESAAADPGPACYGRGGTRPTVTDCNLLLGYVDPDSFLGGEFKLDVKAAQRAVAAASRRTARRIGRRGGVDRARGRQRADGAGDAHHDRGARARSARARLHVLRRRRAGACHRSRAGAGDQARHRPPAARPLQRLGHGRGGSPVRRADRSRNRARSHHVPAHPPGLRGARTASARGLRRRAARRAGRAALHGGLPLRRPARCTGRRDRSRPPARRRR